MTADLHYTDARLAWLYDQTCGLGPDLAFYLTLAPTKPARILDIGCGTGTLALAFADLGHQVTGVDPASAMLAVAGGKPRGGAVRWLHGTAQGFVSADRFDLVVMTGHAFQTLVEDRDISAAMRSIAGLLAQGGTFAFETRNATRNWAARWHEQHEDHVLAGDRVRQSRRVLDAKADRIHFETRYAFPDATLVSDSHLRFLSADEVGVHLKRAGLRQTALYGDWTGAAFDPARSDEMIFLAAPEGPVEPGKAG